MTVCYVHGRAPAHSHTYTHAHYHARHVWCVRVPVPTKLTLSTNGPSSNTTHQQYDRLYTSPPTLFSIIFLFLHLPKSLLLYFHFLCMAGTIRYAWSTHFVKDLMAVTVNTPTLPWLKCYANNHL